MMLDISQHMVTNEVYSLVTVGSGLARKFVSLVLSSPPPPPNGNLQYNQNIYKSSPYSLVGDYNLQCLPEARQIKIMLQSSCL